MRFKSIARFVGIALCIFALATLTGFGTGSVFAQQATFQSQLEQVQQQRANTVEQEESDNATPEHLEEEVGKRFFFVLTGWCSAKDGPPDDLYGEELGRYRATRAGYEAAEQAKQYIHQWKCKIEGYKPELEKLEISLVAQGSSESLKLADYFPRNDLSMHYGLDFQNPESDDFKIPLDAIFSFLEGLGIK